MTDATPPPDQPLGNQARDRIRAELLAAAQASSARSPRWVVPAAAAASVALVAATTAWATGFVGGDSSEGGGLGPATSTSTSPAPPVDDPGPATPVPDEGTHPAEHQTNEGPLDPTPDPNDENACAAALEYVLKGAEQVAAFSKEDGGTTSFWVKGGRFSVCDERAGTTTVHQPLPLAPDLDDVATFRVSSAYPPTPDGYRTIRVAGGLVPQGALAFDVAYTFPDGHTERATTVTDDQGRTWWRMVHEYVDGGVDETQQAPIEVTLSMSGVQKHFSLEWGADTCAQANHGC